MKNKPVIEVFKLIFNTTDSQAAPSVAPAHVGLIVVEVHASWVRPIHRATPIDAARADMADRAIGVAAAR